ncbi:MAG: OmpH family outer membrane protein [Desulfamplus sp.]|nr:OmpH family outer membrane protein [Desulfamplus sp.]MBF0412238.1 OmpH family outer membrane protein [Desulfamplus sp.]
MKKSVVFFAASVVCFISFMTVHGLVANANAASIKIGVVDFQKILTTSTYGKRATEELNRKGKGMEDDIKSKENELLNLQKQFEKDSVVMSKDKKEAKQKELRTKFNDFKTLRAKYMDEFKGMQATHFNKIRNDVLNITNEIGKKEGFTIIIEKNEGGMMYSDPSLDVTDKVISEFNRRPANK